MEYAIKLVVEVVGEVIVVVVVRVLDSETAAGIGLSLRDRFVTFLLLFNMDFSEVVRRFGERK